MSVLKLVLKVVVVRNHKPIAKPFQPLSMQEKSTLIVIISYMIKVLTINQPKRVFLSQQTPTQVRSRKINIKRHSMKQKAVDKLVSVLKRAVILPLLLKVKAKQLITP